MEQKEKEKCLNVIKFLKQNEELKAFMEYNKDYFDKIEKNLNNNLYSSRILFYKSLTLRFFKPADRGFRCLIDSFRALCNKVVVDIFGNNFINFKQGCNYRDYTAITERLHDFYIDFKGQKLIDNLKNYINNSVNITYNNTKAENYSKTKKIADQLEDFSDVILGIYEARHNESARLRDIKLKKREGISKKRKMHRNLNRQQHQYSTLADVKTDLDIYYPESKEPSTEALPLLW